ncbi:MAG: AAA family ATPase [Rikenellaceae bacterium]
MKNTNYIPRNIDSALLDWSKDSRRKPLLLRGARQVGKSSAIRNLGSKFKYFVEVNFDKNQDIHLLFNKNLSPQELCEQLSLIYNTPIIAGETLLFLDEIQSCEAAISSLRYFYEDYPELHIVAAGSLLEFALESLTSFGVGRIRSMYIYPFSFEEFLGACKEDALWKAISNASAERPLLEPIHRKALSLLKKFFVLGGMPEVISAYTEGAQMLECLRIMDDLIISYRDDFSKYNKRVPESRISEVFDSVVMNSGKPFVYAGAANANTRQIKEALELLIKAGLVIPATHSSANGIPLGAEVNPKKRKMLLFDTGLFQRMLGLDLSELILSDDLEVVNKGAIAEIFVGLELQKSNSPYSKEELYFWKREVKNSNAEVDYVFQQGENIIPLEVKAGTRGSMQSMHLFISEKSSEFGVRCSSENFSSFDKIKVIPLYAAGKITK